MADEYTQHRQCQTCYVHFSSSHELTDHIERYRSRERLLLAELERCRMHIAQCDDAISNKGSGDDCTEGADQGLLAALNCPFDGCERTEPYTTRGNLVRHFQKHVQCNEICPFCGEVFRQVHRYLRHDCKGKEDESKKVFVQHRVAQFHKDVSRELDALQGRGKKRRRVIPDSCSEQATTIRGFSEPGAAVNAPGEAPFQPGSAGATDGAPKTKAQRLEPAESALGESTAIRGANVEERDLDHAADEAVDGEWAFASTGPLACAKNDMWDLDQSVLGLTSYGEWAFANPGVNPSVSSGDWSFDHNFVTMASGDSGWGGFFLNQDD
ncbi:hypothetical protein CCHR01_14343 [Colletotrichum chrysophilum]|uniref:Uncharacterized protein n=1 Tax=Colletotrichum chrysophilum TaxID=1836956 RepID=A0AAD9A7S9_9PEZI|nr:hypothetical protein CCHR01_14343 [Colletotrichum chrysophilum]